MVCSTKRYGRNLSEVHTQFPVYFCKWGHELRMPKSDDSLGIKFDGRVTNGTSPSSKACGMMPFASFPAHSTALIGFCVRLCLRLVKAPLVNGGASAPARLSAPILVSDTGSTLVV